MPGLGPKTMQLIAVLDQLSTLLSSLNGPGYKHWAMWMQESKKRLVNSDYSGIEHLLSAYGGMGSLNDIYIDDLKLYTQFEELKREAHTLAIAIKQEAGN